MVLVALASLQIYLSLSASPLGVLHHYQYHVQSTFTRSSPSSRKSHCRSGRKMLVERYYLQSRSSLSLLVAPKLMG